MKIYLASTSPRRKQLLKWLGFRFMTLSPDVDETPRRQEHPRALIRRLSAEKAVAASSKILSGIFLAADTVVVSPRGIILGKPKHAQDAERMLKALSGKTHTVLTGYCIYQKNRGKTRKTIRCVATRVTFKKLSRQEIKAYLKIGEYKDKAGSYGAQGAAMAFIVGIRGSFTNVVGLPLSEVAQELKRTMQDGRP